MQRRDWAIVWGRKWQIPEEQKKWPLFRNSETDLNWASCQLLIAELREAPGAGGRCERAGGARVERKPVFSQAALQCS